MDPSSLGQLQEGFAIPDRNQSFIRPTEKVLLQLPINPRDAALRRKLSAAPKAMRSAFFCLWLCDGRERGDPPSSPCGCETRVDAFERGCSAETCVSFFFSGAACV